MRPIQFDSRIRASFALLLALSCLPAIAQKPAAILTIQLDKPLHAVSPMLYGMMTEEINYSYDGGLYPEMVKNRTMRDRDWNQQDWLTVQNAAGGGEV